MHSLTKYICRTLRAFQADPLRASKTASRSHFTSSSSSRDVFVNPCQRAIPRVQSSRLECLASTTTRGCTSKPAEYHVAVRNGSGARVEELCHGGQVQA
ncbi:hypothetical protein IG631_01468 [Alternaria alternata]|nr:hypothetical protein IG631_01468 [Alternaria alternata]